MSLRLALVDDLDHAGRFDALAADLPLEWVVLRDTDAHAVIEQAAAGGLDAVFCTLAAAGDGAQLLQDIRDIAPETLRILVLPQGHAACAASRLAAHPAIQQVLTAPFSAPDVRAVMRRVLVVRGLLRDPALRDALGSIGRLPASPSAYLSLRMLAADEASGMKEVVHVLQRDPVLAVRVLRTANSALYSRGRAINDLSAATQRLGIETIALLVLANEVFSRVPSQDEALEGRALTASVLATRIAPSPREASLAGSAALLADLGTLLPGSVLNAGPLPGELGRSAPRAALLGAGLIALWGLPMEMVEAVAFHHRPSMMKGRGLDVVGAVHIARALVGAVPLDADYVADAGLADRLPGWQAILEGLGES